MTADQEELESFINKNIGDFDKIESALNTEIKLASAKNIPKGYTYVDDGIVNPKGISAGGVTLPYNENGRRSTILISPNSKGDYFGKIQATHMTIVHEFVHANHLLKGLANFNNYTEAAASMYTFAYLKAYGSRNGASFYYKNLKNYPQTYSWRNLPNVINPGIK